MANRILTKGAYTVPVGESWEVQGGQGSIMIGTVKFDINQLTRPDGVSTVTTRQIATTVTTVADLITAINGALAQQVQGNGGIGIPASTTVEVLGSSVLFVEDGGLISVTAIIDGAGSAAETTLEIGTGTGRVTNQARHAMATLHSGAGSATLRTYSDTAGEVLTETIILDLDELSYPIVLDDDTTAIGALTLELNGNSLLFVELP